MQYQVSKDAYQVIPDIVFIGWIMLMSGSGVRDVYSFCVLGHLFFPNFHTHHLTPLTTPQLVRIFFPQEEATNAVFHNVDPVRENTRS